MAILFFDSSAIVQRYIAEAGSQWVADVMLQRRTMSSTLALSLARKSFHWRGSRRRTVAPPTWRKLDAGSSRAGHRRSLDDWARLYDVISADKQVINQAMLLAQRHSLHGYDAVQLASALEAATIARQAQTTCTLISADDELNAAAAAEGLQVENPDLHP